MRYLSLVLVVCHWIPLNTAFALGGSTCAEATVIGTLPYTDSGQLDSGVDPNCPGEPVNDLFYVFTAPTTGNFRFDMCGSNSCCGHQLSIWGNGLCCAGSSVIVDAGCVDGYPLLELYMLAGQTIFIEIGKSGSAWADAPLYQFNVSLISDACPGTVITALPYSHSGTTVYSTDHYSGTCYIGLGRDMVFQFTSPDSVLARATVLAPWNEALQVRRNNCATGASLQCDVGVGPDSSWYEFWAEPDSAYYFIVDGAGTYQSGPYTFTLQNITLPNDTCPGTVIPALPYSDSGNTEDASHQYNGCNYEPARDVVYNFTSPYSVVVRASMVANWTHFIYVRRNDCATGAFLTCDSGTINDSAWFVFWAEPDSTYYFIVDGHVDWVYGPYTFTLQEINPLPNDTCPGTLITSLPYTDNGSTDLATNQYNGSCYTQSAPDLVYQFTSPESVLVRSSMVAPWFDCMQVRKNDCANGASFLCDFGFYTDSSWFDFWAEPDSTYYFIVDGAYYWDFGDYIFTLTSLSCPAPDSLTILQSADDVILRWPHVDCDTPTYHVYRANTPDVEAIPANEIAVIADTTYTDIGILNDLGDKFFYVVTATY